MATLNGRVVVADDDKEIRTLLRDFLSAEGHTSTCFPNAIEALRALRPGGAFAAEGGERVDIVVTDLKMAQMGGMEFLRTLKRERPELPVIVVTAFASVDSAVEAMRNGAYDYIIKPFKLAELAVVIEHALAHGQLARDNAELRSQLQQSWRTGQMLGKSQGMRAVFDLITRVAPSTANVLITGESGTGKEMVARAIHAASPRAAKPFVAINCTAIPDELLESELFGHAKGAFTGAIYRKKGLFEEADGGTLFLDEIGDMAPTLQAKLLRVLQERKIRAVGDTLLTDIDVRIVTATHKDLKAAIREERFREDLFYRLSVIPIGIPPLRERQEDIPMLAEHFVQKYAAANASPVGTRVRGISKSAVARLMSMPWHGNVRELENLIERLVVLATGPVIDEQDIPILDDGLLGQSSAAIYTDFPTLAQLEQRYMEVVLRKTAGRKDKAAQILGINRRTLYRKEREFGWVVSDPAQEEESDIAPEDPTSANRMSRGPASALD